MKRAKFLDCDIEKTTEIRPALHFGSSFKGAVCFLEVETKIFFHIRNTLNFYTNKNSKISRL
jgi:hypothetical protein